MLGMLRLYQYGSISKKLQHFIFFPSTLSSVTELALALKISYPPPLLRHLHFSLREDSFVQRTAVLNHWNAIKQNENKFIRVPPIHFVCFCSPSFDSGSNMNAIGTLKLQLRKKFRFTCKVSTFSVLCSIGAQNFLDPACGESLTGKETRWPRNAHVRLLTQQFPLVNFLSGVSSSLLQIYEAL